jgi:hypothetical protein
VDCSLAPRLVELATLVHRYGVDEVRHLGVYNYRCIGGGDPDADDCAPSQHAFARAIDLHELRTVDGDRYNVETDFRRRDGETCPGPPGSSDNAILYRIACELWAEGIFQIVLTPNYNAAHRNHFHVDLTPGSMFIAQTSRGVDPPVSGLGH